MAKETLHFRIEGTRPLLMHSGALADPLNAIAKEMKRVSGKRAKTDADFEQLAKLEFRGGLWLHQGAPCVPSHVLEAVFTEAARKSKKGKQATAGVVVPQNAPLEYDGPKDPEQLWEQRDHYALTVGVRIQRNKVMRTRPKFDKWGAEFDVEYETGLLNANEVKEILETAGDQVGIGDWRPKFGLFRLA
jgi:hypothetical protein